jgi:hypothetical protein
MELSATRSLLPGSILFDPAEKKSWSQQGLNPHFQVGDRPAPKPLYHKDIVDVKSFILSFT